MILIFQSESPSESELNALGLYLLVCLAFVIFALVEFAITILLSQRSHSKDTIKTETNSKSNRSKKRVSGMSQITKFESMGTICQPSTPTISACGQYQFLDRVVNRMQKWSMLFQPTQVLDFIAAWIHLFLFLLFNCIYWNTY